MTRETMPFNDAEVELQTRLGVHNRVMSYAPRMIRDHMPLQHREFYAQLPILFVGSVDEQQRPWASALFGHPGFVSSPRADVLRVSARPSFGDPLQQNLQTGASLGVLGLEHHTRRRNRLAGKVGKQNSKGFEILVDQAFGNCPRYIHAQTFQVMPEVDQVHQSRSLHRMETLNHRAKDMISTAQSFFIATYYQEDPDNPSHGADASHRGGKPGFVKVVDDRTLIYPEFSGNLHYNTLGNIHKNPKAGLLFIDFENGDILYLTCTAEILWGHPDTELFDGAENMVGFQVMEGILVEGAMPLRWQSLEVSPYLAGSGSWEQVSQRQEANRNAWQDYRVIRMVRESNDISSFFLKPVNGGSVPKHKAGQFLPIRLQPNGSGKAVNRTYTISSGPDERYIRLSIKREAGSGKRKPGLVSNHFHDHISPGSIISARKPAGKFVLSEDNRSVVMLSAGVGITPMISMLTGLVRSAQEVPEKIYFIHGARDSSHHAFRDEVEVLSRKLPQLEVKYRYSQPSEEDLESHITYSQGRINLSWLKSILPLNTYHYYICGPESFMGELVNGLRSMNVPEERIHFEFFGRNTLASGKKEMKQLRTEPIKVEFRSSDVETEWNPEKGSLLDLAESEGLEPPFACRTGSCGTCQTKILTGAVDYEGPTPMGLGENQALICSARPHIDSKEPLVLEV